MHWAALPVELDSAELELELELRPKKGFFPWVRVRVDPDKRRTGDVVRSIFGFELHFVLITVIAASCGPTWLAYSYAPQSEEGRECKTRCETHRSACRSDRPFEGSQARKRWTGACNESERNCFRDCKESHGGHGRGMKSGPRER